MQHPKSEDILRVINDFKSVVHLANNEICLNMGAINICSTVLCHAGWYMQTIAKEKRVGTVYTGIKAMSLALGFSGNCLGVGDNDICYWAKRNKDVWGNESAGVMFSDKMAFLHPTKRPNGAKSLQDIIDHWEEVYERVLALEQPEKIAQPQYKNISKELAQKANEEKQEVDVVVKIINEPS